MTTAGKAILIYIAGVLIAVLLAWNWENEQVGFSPAIEVLRQGDKIIEVKVDGEDVTHEFLPANPTADIVYMFPTSEALETVEAFDLMWGTAKWECRPKEIQL